MIRPDDLEHCRAAIRTGSLSFYAASKLLPRSVRDPSLALYAFCRLADDEVDEGEQKASAVLRLRDRLDLAYEGRPENAPEDRAFAAIIEHFDMPRELPEALLEGLAWDAMGRRYETLSDVRGYSARVASAVGAMMCVLMKVRDPDTLARACDLGVAMQLTNIARDVGEDARAGRIYLPTEWFDDAGLNVDGFLNDPKATDVVAGMVKRLLEHARQLYFRSQAGINALPLNARTGIWAARLVYDGIGTEVRRNRYNSIDQRAHTSKLQKVGWLAQAAGHSAVSLVMPKSPVLYATPLPEVAFLVEAAGDRRTTHKRSKAVLDILAELSLQDAALDIQQR